MSEDIFKKLAELISSTKGIPIEKISIDSSFQELGMDSLDAVELIADLEEAFDVTIPNAELQNFKTIRQAVDSLSRITSKSS